MNQTAEFQSVFDTLKGILGGVADDLVCVTDEPDNYYLNTRHIMKNKKPLFFGAVQVRKNYVSYHLMPVYVTPDLLKGMSPQLKKRMQGKSCFNFKSVDAIPHEELSALTRKGLASYQESGYMG